MPCRALPLSTSLTNQVSSTTFATLLEYAVVNPPGAVVHEPSRFSISIEATSGTCVGFLQVYAPYNATANPNGGFAASYALNISSELLPHHLPRLENFASFHNENVNAPPGALSPGDVVGPWTVAVYTPWSACTYTISTEALAPPRPTPALNGAPQIVTLTQAGEWHGFTWNASLVAPEELVLSGVSPSCGARWPLRLMSSGPNGDAPRVFALNVSSLTNATAQPPLLPPIDGAAGGGWVFALAYDPLIGEALARESHAGERHSASHTMSPAPRSSNCTLKLRRRAVGPPVTALKLGSAHLFSLADAVAEGKGSALALFSAPFLRSRPFVAVSFVNLAVNASQPPCAVRVELVADHFFGQGASSLVARGPNATKPGADPYAVKGGLLYPSPTLVLGEAQKEDYLIQISLQEESTYYAAQWCQSLGVLVDAPLPIAIAIGALPMRVSIQHGARQLTVLAFRRGNLLSGTSGLSGTGGSGSAGASNNLILEVGGISGECEGMLGVRMASVPVGVADARVVIAPGTVVRAALWPMLRPHPPLAPTDSDGIAFFEPQRGECNFTVSVHARGLI